MFKFLALNKNFHSFTFPILNLAIFFVNISLWLQQTFNSLEFNCHLLTFFFKLCYLLKNMIRLILFNKICWFFLKRNKLQIIHNLSKTLWIISHKLQSHLIKSNLLNISKLNNILMLLSIPLIINNKLFLLILIKSLLFL